MDNFIIAVTIGSRNLKVTSDGTEEGTVFDGKPGDVKIAITSAKRKDPVSFGKFGESPIANSGFESAIALTAALYSISPETVRLVEAPEEVYEFLNLSPESNPGVTDTAAMNNNAVKLEVSKKDTPLQKTMRPPYPGKDIQIVQQNGIYGEVAFSAIISMICIGYLFILRENIPLGLRSILVSIIVAVGTPLAIYCAIKSLIKLKNNKDFSNVSYVFVVLSSISLPLIFLFDPNHGIIEQLFDYSTNDSGGPWRGY